MSRPADRNANTKAFWMVQRQDSEPNEVSWVACGRDDCQLCNLVQEELRTRVGDGSNPSNSLQYPLTYGIGLAISRERMALLIADPTLTTPDNQNGLRHMREAPPPHPSVRTDRTRYTRQTTVPGTKVPWLGQSPNPFGVTTWNEGRPEGLTRLDKPEYSPLHEDHERIHWTKCFYDRCMEHLDDKARNWWFPRRVSAEVLEEDPGTQGELKWFQVAEWTSERPGERRITWVARDEECPTLPQGWRFCNKPGCWYHGGDWGMYMHRQDTRDQDDILGGQEVVVTPEQGTRIAALMEAAREGDSPWSTRGPLRRGTDLKSVAKLPGLRRDEVTRRALRDAMDTWAK